MTLTSYQQKISDLKTARTILETYKLSVKDVDALIITLSVGAIKEINAEITDLQSRIDSIHLIEIPKDASEEVAMLVAQANEFPTGEKIMFETRLREKQDLLNELKAL